MKKTLAVSLCLFLTLGLSGCGLEQIKEKYIEETETTPTPSPEPKERVYMDQFTGKVQDFDGQNLVLSSDGSSYFFDASKASVETSHGLIAGDEVTVIYEGKLSGPNAVNVKALKVVDDLHKESSLEEQVIEGTLTRITQNSLSFTDTGGRNIVCSCPGASQYYRNGLREGIHIYVRYLGNIPDVDPGARLTLQAPLIRVRSISDTDPVPAPPSLSSSVKVREEGSSEYTVRTESGRGHIRSLENNILQVIPNGASEAVPVDLSKAECWFDGGFCSGTGVDLQYSGESTAGDFKDAVIYRAIGDDPDGLKTKQILYYVSGKIVGMTANTITLKTADNMSVIMQSEGVPNSAGDLLYGRSVRVLFDPAASRDSNILASIRIRSTT